MILVYLMTRNSFYCRNRIRTTTVLVRQRNGATSSVYRTIDETEEMLFALEDMTILLSGQVLFK
jgi:hypothetical protein